MWNARYQEGIIIYGSRNGALQRSKRGRFFVVFTLEYIEI